MADTITLIQGSATLDLDDGRITQLTHEPWVGRATWAPDGLAIIYMARETATTIRRVDVRTRKTETIHAVPKGLRSVFYLTDGQLAWIVNEGANPLQGDDCPGERNHLRHCGGRCAFRRD